MNANNLSCLIYCRCSLLLFAALGLTVTNHSFAAEEAEFDSEFLHLDKGINVIDIRRFSHGNPVPEGRYYSDIYVNNVWKGKADLQYLRTANTRKKRDKLMEMFQKSTQYEQLLHAEHSLQ